MKVGDYIRTKDGVIAKIEDIIDDYSIDCDRDVFDLNYLAMMEIPYCAKDEYIIKSSPNIIDLIDVGDYVNGHKVIYTIGNIYKRIYVEYVNMDELLEIKLEQIKSIVTKEQFENMKYRIGE